MALVDGAGIIVCGELLCPRQVEGNARAKLLSHL